MSTNDAGVVARKAQGRLPPEPFVKALCQGLWSKQLDLYNMAKIWEQMMVGRGHSLIPEDQWYMDAAHLLVMLQLGVRLFNAISRAGGDELSIGSFQWVMKTGIDLLHAKSSHTCPEREIEDIVAWWFRAAFTEAGAAFSDETKADADFSQPLQNIFLYNNGRGCITQLQAKLASLDKWELLADDLPHTIGSILAANNTGAGSVSRPPATSLSTFLDPIVRPAAITITPAPPAPPGSAYNSTAQTIVSLQAEVHRLTQSQGTGKGTGKGSGKGGGKGKGRGKGSSASGSAVTSGNFKAIGSDAQDMVSYEDTNGVTQHNSSLNVVLSVKFKHHIRKALVNDL